MKRRQLMAVLGGAAAWPLAGRTRQLGERPIIGVLSPGTPNPSPSLEAFLSGLRDLGYVEGQGMSIIWKFSGNRTDRLLVLADELVQAQVDLIFAINTPAALAAKNATTRIPIVVTRVSDPVRTGLVASLADPGANLTGLTTMSEEVEGVIFEAERMLVAAADGRASLPPNSPSRFFLAYTGTYRFDGAELVTADDASRPELVVDQVRHIRFESPTRMVAIPVSGVAGANGIEVVWERIA
jgi:hypothetical protein